MNKEESERVAQAVRQSGLLVVYRVCCLNHETQAYAVECGYRGASRRLGKVFLEHGIRVYLRSPLQWATLRRVIVEGEDWL